MQAIINHDIKYLIINLFDKLNVWYFCQKKLSKTISPLFTY